MKAAAASQSLIDGDACRWKMNIDRMKWCVPRSESLSAESRSVQSSPSYRLMKSRSESDLSQPESDEEGYTLVLTRSLAHSLIHSRHHVLSDRFLNVMLNRSGKKWINIASRSLDFSNLASS